ncbi:ABC transporter ATP-binding protein [bacterium]|nr:ABC transporter ATP-binding protein [bacterium]
MIDIKKLTKTYQDKSIEVHALQGVDLHIDEGEFAAIVGPSGSGKTTLLNLIGGLDVPSGGEIEIGGEKLQNLDEKALVDFRLKNIGFVFQAYNLIPVLTSLENVGFIMQLQGFSEEERNTRALHLLKEVGLENEVNRKPGELSGGQQQRVAVARALAAKPKFILADEPTANLDSKSTANLLDIMARLNKEENITFIFSTHDQRVIDRAQRIITLEDGIIVTDDKNN